MRSCEDCHEVEASHAWLPQLERHLHSMRCEVCHIPRVFTPALMSIDATVVTPEAKPRLAWRGVVGPAAEASSLIRGFEPALLVRREVDGRARLAPYQLVAVWSWVAGRPPRALSTDDVFRALYDGGSLHADVARVFDGNGNGTVDADELHTGTKKRLAAVRARLVAAGHADVAVRGRLVAQGLHHTVATGRHAVRACNECHAEQSRMSRPLRLDHSGLAPAGGVLELPADSPVVFHGRFADDQFHPDPSEAGYYVLGHDAAVWIDWLGLLFAGAVLAGAGTHGAMRFAAHRRRAS